MFLTGHYRLRSEWHLPGGGSIWSRENWPRCSLHRPTCGWNPTPSSGPVQRTAPPRDVSDDCDTAMLGRVKPHKGVGFQPNEALPFQAWRDVEKVQKIPTKLTAGPVSKCHPSLVFSRTGAQAANLSHEIHCALLHCGARRITLPVGAAVTRGSSNSGH